MKYLSAIMGWVSVAAIVDVVWLHAGSYGAEDDWWLVSGDWRRVVWGLAVPWFFVNACVWMAVKWKGFQVEMARRVWSLVVPYFCWCLLGAAWSIALHGVRLHGWDLLRYAGLHPWKDPAYQPMWFIRNLFLVLLVEAGVLASLKVKVSSLKFLVPYMTRWIFPVYVIHSLWLSAARVMLNKPRFEGWEAFGVTLGAIGLSVASAWCLERFLPCVARLLFGERLKS